MKNRLLIVADFINEIVHPDGLSGKQNADRVARMHTMEKANQAITWAREQGVAIAHVRVGFSEGYPECPKRSPMFGRAPEFKAFQLDTWGTEFHEKMDVQPQDLIVTKHRVSALYATNLEPYLRAHKIEHVILCGVSTTYVVESTARELHDRDYQVTIIGDACNAGTESSHQSSLDALSRFCEIIEVKSLGVIHE
ncbi:cysteine hydrolase [Francisellaceae bacterium]|nr:cysteine hydrolase [Francisellaceae bacterium]